MMIVAAFSRNNLRRMGRRRQSRLCQNDIIRVRKKKDSVVDGKSQSRTTLVNSTTGFASAILMMVVCFGSSVVQRAFYKCGVFLCVHNFTPILERKSLL